VLFQAHFGYATVKQIRKMLRLFYTNEAKPQETNKNEEEIEKSPVSDKGNSADVRQKLQMNEQLINRSVER